MVTGLPSPTDATLADMGWRGGGVSEITRPDGTIVYRARAYLAEREVPCGIWPTYELAEAAVRRTRERLGHPALLSGRDTLREWGGRWLDRREVGGRVRGIDEERSVWRRQIMPAAFADLALTQITRPMVVRWIYERLHEGRRTLARRVKRGGVWTMDFRETEQPLSRGTVRHALNLLRLCLRAACDEGELSANAAADVRIPRADDSRIAWTWLRPDEIDLALEVDDEHARILWTLAIYTGLRKGELAGLRWCDVDLGVRPHLRVERSYAGPTKSGKPREVPLLPPAYAALKAWRELERGIALRPVFPSASDGVRASWWEPGDWPRRSLDLLKRPVRFHDLRHTCASHLVQGTWGRALSLYEVGAWLGHGDPKTTMRYAHLAPEGLHARAGEMAASWASAGDEEDEGADVVPIDGGG